MAIVTVRDTDHGCEVWAHRDGADDVAGHLRSQGLLVDGPVPDIRTNMQLMTVRMPEGDLLRAEQVRPLLVANMDFEVVDWPLPPEASQT
jgi:hypothetical protein